MSNQISWNDKRRPKLDDSNFGGVQDEQPRRWSASGIAVTLGAVSVASALLIGFVAYRYTLKSTEQRYRRFYQEKAKFLVAHAISQEDLPDDALLELIETFWRLSENKPRDEHLCILDHQAQVLVHTRYPWMQGLLIGDNPIVEPLISTDRNLKDFIKRKSDFAGAYITNSGEEKIAAFAWFGRRNWMVGVLRSTAAIEEEVESGVRFLVVSFIVVCGLLIPVSLVLLHGTFRKSQQKRKQAVESLRQSEARFRTLADTTEAAIFIWLDTKFLFANARLETITGYSHSELLSMDFWEIMHPDCRDTVRGQGLALQHGALDRTRLETRMLSKDGREIWIDLTAAVIDFEGEQAVIGTALDITERKQAEERLLQSERVAAIGQMVTGLAHESRNALQRSQACLEMLEAEVTDQPKAADLIGRIQVAQDHLHHLYEEVRRYAAPIIIEHEPCDLGILIRDTWSNLDVVRANGHVRFVENVNGVNLNLQIDRHRVEQVFRNILENAINACGEAGEISVDYCETDLEGREAVRVAVSDSGPGLSADERRHIFEPFFTTKTHGTGLGMSIVKRIVSAHGGEIAVSSNNGGGATIEVTLPRATS